MPHLRTTIWIQWVRQIPLDVDPYELADFTNKVLPEQIDLVVEAAEHGTVLSRVEVVVPEGWSTPPSP